MKIVHDKKVEPDGPMPTIPSPRDPVLDALARLIGCFEFEDDDDPLFTRNVAIVYLIADTGLRPVDLPLLRWQHIFPMHRTSMIKGIDGDDISSWFYAPVHGKQGAKPKPVRVSISEPTRTQLAQYLNPEVKLSDPVFKSDRVRSGSNAGNALSHKSISNIWNDMTRRAGFGSLTIHAIRKARDMGRNDSLTFDAD